ncbi:excisionase (plasmid) [Deinococcus aetherius]|uniref:Excisionase n=1 Tax=Deinococcus aetherius TaxID=200252 RepID=A0ABM8AJ03_9DEIO|nr:helix-turn-helix domain-containing protein [Deinococcus aetherius]BDP43786.1 excisionase [Deinococcus aetherius]
MTTPFLPTPSEAEAARTQLEQLQSQAGQVPARLAGILEDLLGQLAAGKAVQVVTLDREISTQQAADLLNVSRPYLVKLVEEGVLPHRKVGPRRRLYLEDVLAYKARLDAQRQTALQALADDLQAMGLD